MENNILKGHLAALITVVIWGTTFVSTKILLVDFSPIEILVSRFLIGYATLWLVYPRHLPFTDSKKELYIAAAGLCGITLYYLLENIALTYTLASNVGVIVSVTPFFTAILSYLFLRSERPGIRFYLGFALAITGIYFISFSKTATLQLNPLGDMLALIAALIWSIYSLLTKKISSFGYNTIQATRRTFFYGLLLMLPTLYLMGFEVQTAQWFNPTNLFNILFLGFGASALCFVTWNFAVRCLGSIKTSVYIYMVPVITASTSAIVLQERMDSMTALGIVLTLSGLFLSESKRRLS